LVAASTSWRVIGEVAERELDELDFRVRPPRAAGFLAGGMASS
jgi:hypothetical protein